MQSTVINGKIYLGGGQSEYIYCYDPSEDNWTSLPPLPTKQFGLGEFSGMLVAIGGVNYSNQQPTNTLYTLTGTKSQKWDTKIPPMPTARHSVAVAGLKSALLVAGGTLHTGKSTNAVEVFKTETTQWYQTDYFQLPTPCSNPSLVVMDDTLYIMGGYNMEGERLSHYYLNQAMYASVNDILAFAEYDEIEYDEIDGNSDVEWKTLHHTPSYHPVAAILDGNLLAICGHEEPETTTIQKKVYMFRPPINSWVYVSDLPDFIQCTTSVKLSPKEIVVIGSDANKLTTIFKGSVASDMNIQV